MAEHLARRYVSRGEPLDDLVLVGTVGLIKAVDRFDPEQGADFLSFALPTITGELRRYFRDHGWATRVPRRLKDLHVAIRGTLGELSQQLGRAPRPSEIADRLGLPISQVIEGLHAGDAYRSVSLDAVLGSGNNTATLSEFIGDVDAVLDLIDDRELLRLSLAALTPRQRTILELRFFHHLTQTQIAEQIGLSQMHVSRLLRQTLASLEQRMTSPG